MPQCRDPVVHKIFITKLFGYLFILKNIISEEWSLDKTLPSLIRRVIELPSSCYFSVSVVECSQHRLPNSQVLT